MDSDRYKIGFFFCIFLHMHCNKNKINANQFYFTSYWAIIFWPDYHYRSTSENFSPDVYNSNLALKISEGIFEKSLLPSIIIITRKKLLIQVFPQRYMYWYIYLVYIYIPHLFLVISRYLLATVVLIGFNVVALLCVCVFLLNTQQRRLIVS